MSNALFRNVVSASDDIFIFEYPSDSIVRYIYKVHGFNYRDELIKLCVYEGPRTECFIEENLVSLFKLKYAHLKMIESDFQINHTHIQFYFGFDIKIEASATMHKNVEYINISFGLMFKVYDLCMKILLANDLFLDVGNPSSSVVTSKDLNIYFVTNVKGYDSDGNYYPNGDMGFFLSHLVPTCPIRYNYAKSIYYCILYYVYLHELGHHFRGHIQFWKNKYNLDCYSEFQIHKQLASNFEYLKIRRSLEFDADCYALRTLLQMRDTGFNEYFGMYTDKEKIQIIFTAVNFINRIFDVEYPKELYTKLSTHPYPSVRNGKSYIKRILDGHFDASTVSSLMEEYECQQHNISKLWENVGVKAVTFVDKSKIEDQEKEIFANDDNLSMELNVYYNKRKKILRRKIKQNYR